jgi:IS5 family transposase
VKILFLQGVHWSKKNSKTHFDFKSHINADQTHKLIRAYTVTNAAVHDSQAIVLDKEADANGNKCPVYADSANCSVRNRRPTAAKSPRSERAWNTSSVRRRKWADTGCANWLATGKGQTRDDEFLALRFRCCEKTIFIGSHKYDSEKNHDRQG